MSLRFNGWGVWAVYKFEMARFKRTIIGSLITPLITSALNFDVFGSAIGPPKTQRDPVPYRAFILPGEWEVAGLTEALAEEVGFDLEAARQQPRLYPSLFGETL